MLIAIGFLLVVTIVGLLITRKVSPLIAFSVPPLIAGLIAGFGPAELGEHMTAGIATVFPTASLFIFAILFFGVMRERGLFDPAVQWLVGLIRERPVGLTLVTVAVASVTHIDGVGATTFLLTIPALLPVYDRLKMRRLVLVFLTGITAGVINMVPWGGPTIRAATTINEDPGELWLPLVPVQIFGLIIIIVCAVILGKVEQRRISEGRNDVLVTETVAAGSSATSETSVGNETPISSETRINSAEATQVPPKESVNPPLALSPRNWRYWVNLALTVALLIGLFTSLMPLNLLFVVGFGVALLVNFPNSEAQDQAMNRHAKEALSMGGILIVVGVFLGVLNGTGMLDAMGGALIGLVSSGAAGWVHIAFGAIAVPLGMVFGPDAMFFGLLPLLVEVGGSAGVPAADVARALLIGENTGFSISPVVPSVYLAVGLAGVKLGDHIRFAFPWAWGIGLTLLAFGLAIGVVGF